MPNTIVVTCAGCGRRYKGTPGSRRYRCTNCDNALTFPRVPRSAIPGKAWCSNCWRATDSSLEHTSCPACKQKIGTREGGRASLPSLFTSAADPLPIDDQDERLICTAQDLKAKILAAQVAAMLGDHTPTTANEPREASAEPQPTGIERQEETAGAGNGASGSRNVPLVQREMALKMDDPWRKAPDEVNSASARRQNHAASEGCVPSKPRPEALVGYAATPKANDQPPGASNGATAECEASDGPSAQAPKARDEALALVDQLQTERAALQRELDYLRETAIKTLEPLCEDYARRTRDLIAEADRVHVFIQHVRQDVNRRLEMAESAVGELRDQLAAAGQEMNERLAKVIGTEPHKLESVHVPAFASNGPFVELLAAGLPPGAVVTVSHHAPADGHAKSPAA